jgi:hypothetical protein
MRFLYLRKMRVCMKDKFSINLKVAALLTSSLLVAGPQAPLLQASPWNGDDHHIRHVLLLSIDGMHVLDLINCVNGVGSVSPYCPNLAALETTGLDYLDTSTSKPSDSFPGLMALMTGGSPRTVGAFYDDAYDRSLDPPTIATGNGLAGGTCAAGQAPTGTSTEYDEGIDLNQNVLNGGAPAGVDGGIASIDSQRLVRDPSKNCAPVFPWNFVRTNTIFGVIHAAGGYTAWSDKHPSYSAVAGPGDGSNLDDYYSPEINSIPVSLPSVPGCNPINDPNFSNNPAQNNLGSYTDSFAAIACYDSLKVNAILNEIDGYSHNRSVKTKVPAIFGMNFQAVSVGQKLIESGVGTGGYLDNMGTPSTFLQQEIQFVDGAIGSFVSELQKQGLLDSTLIIVTAKHGQSPIDSARYTRLTSSGAVTTSPSMLIDSCLPASESNAGNQLGPTEDDVSLLWLSSSCTTANAVSTLESASPASANIAGIGEIFSGPGLTQLFNAPGLPPNGDPRTPDILITPNIGVTYSASKKKQAEHGGFAHDDVNVLMLLSNPHFEAKTITTPVLTLQVAPTVLAALGLDPHKLDAVRLEGTPVLPGFPVE